MAASSNRTRCRPIGRRGSLVRKLSIVKSTIGYEGASVSRSMEINYYSALVLQAGGAPARPLPDTIALLEELTDFSVIPYKLTSGSSHSEVKARDE